MRRTIAALALLALIPGLAPALEIVNLRPSYGPHGTTRKEGKVPKVIQGDLFWVEYAIDGLKVDEKSGKVSYETVLEFFDATNKALFAKPPTRNEAILQLGGSRMPGDMHVITGTSAPGKYTIKLTVKDKLATKETSIVYPIEIVPTTLGFIHVEAPALGLPGQASGVGLLVTGYGLDAKKDPNVEVTIRMLDANEKAVSTPVQTIFPRDIPMGADLSKQPGLPVVFPLMPNRPGQYYFDIVAVDKNSSNKQVQLRLPVTILDIGTVTGGK